MKVLIKNTLRRKTIHDGKVLTVLDRDDEQQIYRVELPHGGSVWVNQENCQEVTV